MSDYVNDQYRMAKQYLDEALREQNAQNFDRDFTAFVALNPDMTVIPFELCEGRGIDALRYRIGVEAHTRGSIVMASLQSRPDVSASVEQESKVRPLLNKIASELTEQMDKKKREREE